MSNQGINKVFLIGHLGADPEIRHMPSGDAMANVRIATSETWKDKQTGEARERTEWHNVVFFGRLAGVVQEHLHKGSKIYVEGKLRTRKWQTKDGQDRYSTEVVVDMNGNMQMLDSRMESHPQDNIGRQQQPRQTPGEPEFDDGGGDDIPF